MRCNDPRAFFFSIHPSQKATTMRLTNLSTTPKIQREKPVTYKSFLGMLVAVAVFWVVMAMLP